MLLWEVRTQMEAKEAATIENIINNNLHKKSYYLFIHANWTGHGLNELKTTYVLMSKKPPKMLGTKLYLIDNTQGTIEKIWELPMDVIVPQ